MPILMPVVRDAAREHDDAGFRPGFQAHYGDLQNPYGSGFGPDKNASTSGHKRPTVVDLGPCWGHRRCPSSGWPDPRRTIIEQVFASVLHAAVLAGKAKSGQNFNMST